MLQRVQTIFLAITIIGMGIFLSFPIWSKISASGERKSGSDCNETDTSAQSCSD